ncbi:MULTISPECIES: DUF559 domain-containing protein [Bacillus amyloliquefaciens group]|uniref:DUF559 domain-containing protein n=1 Tax=Bacillus amyloliquefaciens group TaxID=1938374 RepID=UPI000DC59F8F|nr:MULTISPECIES: DUF559 domain-containing protein [Bacillus amyloliquefaciens group]MCW8785935.1 DUF559 domain-containing protein [Bacillus velezensis]QPV79447.1 DUF559 domain-containing protein [Bacillus velezensis]RAP14808.1 hypothetical protein HS9_00131 [Bacillus velezensis]UNE51210.1 DUF559 domain-containing protein [Bacillus amyloliquefaciens]
MDSKEKESNSEAESFYISTLEISRRLDNDHKDILKKVRLIAERMLISLNSPNKFIKTSFYINSQNKQQKMYVVSREVVLELLKTCTRKNYIKATQMLDYMSDNDKERYAPKTFSENQFITLIRNLIPSIKVEPQYRVLNYFVDLFIPELKIFIEYDEEYHKRNLVSKNDKHRQDGILDHINDKDMMFIRVNNSNMYKILRKLVFLTELKKINPQLFLKRKEWFFD